MEFKDYRIERAMFDCKFLITGEEENDTENIKPLFIRIPNDIRKAVGINHYNKDDYRIIIVKKSSLDKGLDKVGATKDEL